MSDLIRDAPIGQIIRYITKNKVLKYPEEEEGWKCPSCYVDPAEFDKQQAEAEAESVLEPEYPNIESKIEEAGSEQPTPDVDAGNELEKVETAIDEEPTHEPTRRFETIRAASSKRSELERVGSRMALSQSVSRADLEKQFSLASLKPGPSMPIVPTKTADGTILVDWYTTDDPANPQNWSLKKKIFVACQIYLYTLAVYMGSAIYAPSELGVMERFGVSIQVASLGLSMYVLAYGIGPMLWSPLSELPLIGRNPIYIATYAIFTILLVPTALVDNFAGLVVLRFLAGFFGSPCLATGGASLQDMFSLIKLPYVLSGWAIAATSGPALGPIISGFSVTAENWRWSIWEMLWMSGPIWIVMFLFMPETSSPNILLRRAARLRKLTGDNNLKAQSEIDQANLEFRDLAIESLWRPIQMMFLDPAIAFTAAYTGLIYGIFYSFFEAFPLVYGEMYGFNLGLQGVVFLSITVGVIISVAAYWSYVWYVVEPDIRANGLGAPERRLIPALFATFCCPIGLFIFAWTSRPDIHWMAPTIGIAVFTIGIFLVIQCIFLYLPLTYPQYAASLFAGNDFTRSTLAAGAIHFSRPLFNNLGVDKGVTLLAGFCAGCCAGVYILFFYGDKLRMKSRFAAK
ncbi:benomyl/methotrexate resistance protein [Aulographum hederae CBS 113979]|uniref:Benomyl/methotrexate resistance protein n=1 Tax=Aulographum hederae CBS 113979 TaxID=1176131 RepID=A0A6G1GJS4_9PEZI|nr:benomyl/methotrexate resistance protein [Aulographum hederae CBS 113979]